EHHSNLVPWQLVARSTGARLRFIPLDPATGGLRLNELGSLMTPEVRLLGMTHVSNVLG
ncbi:MAG TPA: cysteine desulfurase, partial [Verrucomicrobiales bacterium]|nr:cysteine desulfurase [Verrucomicrobiales bacterium]